MDSSTENSKVKRVLIVDDNIHAATTTAMLLKLKGHETQYARDGFIALEITKTFIPDLALIDIHMPKMDGFELTRQLREQEQLSGMLIVALTGTSRKTDLSKLPSSGFDAWFTKPLDVGQLDYLLS